MNEYKEVRILLLLLLVLENIDRHNQGMHDKLVRGLILSLLHWLYLLFYGCRFPESLLVKHFTVARQVLTTAWVEGEKLSESRAVDVGPLVTTMLNCYLIQLLESGFLHAGKGSFSTLPRFQDELGRTWALTRFSGTTRA